MKKTYIFAVMTVILFSCSSEDTLEQLPSGTKPQGEVIKETQLDKDLKLLGISQEEYDLVSGKTDPIDHPAHAREAGDILKRILPELTEATEADIQGLEGNDKTAKFDAVVSAVAKFLGNSDPATLKNIWTGANSDKNCSALKTSIIWDIANTQTKEKAWALTRFLPTALDAINNVFSFDASVKKISVCNWDALVKYISPEEKTVITRLLGIHDKDFDIVIGKTSLTAEERGEKSQKEARADHALEVSVKVLTTVVGAVESDVRAFRYKLQIPTHIKVLSAVATFLSTEQVNVSNAFAATKENTEACQKIGESIRKISNKETRDKAWATTRFLPLAMEAMNAEYGFSPFGIYHCDPATLPEIPDAPVSPTVPPERVSIITAPVEPEELSVSDLSKIITDSSNIITGTTATQTAKAEAARDALKRIIPSLTTATEADVQGLTEGNAKLAKFTTVVSAVATFLGDFSTVTLTGMLTNSGLNSKENCTLLKNTIDGLTPDDTKQKAWEFAQFFPIALNAMEAEYNFHPLATEILACDWTPAPVEPTKPSDHTLLGISEDRYNTVMDTSAVQNTRATEALEALKIIIPALAKGKIGAGDVEGIEAGSGSGFLSYTNTQMLHIVLRSVSRNFLGVTTSNQQLLENALLSSDNTVACQTLKTTIDALTTDDKKQKAWAFARFLPTALEAANAEYSFNNAGIFDCDWDNL